MSNVGPMKLALTLSIVFALAACAGTQSNRPLIGSPASVAEKSEAMRLLVECQRAAVRRFDDHVSDAATVGSAVATACTLESQGVLETLARGQSEMRVQALRERWPTDEHQRATGAVLYLRANKD